MWRAKAKKITNTTGNFFATFNSAQICGALVLFALHFCSWDLYPAWICLAFSPTVVFEQFNQFKWEILEFIQNMAIKLLLNTNKLEQFKLIDQDLRYQLIILAWKLIDFKIA